MKYLLIIAGGGIGALLRYSLSLLAQRQFGNNFPYGTLVVNIIGAFIIGFAWEVSQSLIVSDNIKLFVFMGFLGGLTTFSTYSLETVNFFRNNEITKAFTNIVLSNVSCILLVFAGYLSARYLMKLIR